MCFLFFVLLGECLREECADWAPVMEEDRQQLAEDRQQLAEDRQQLAEAAGRSGSATPVPGDLRGDEEREEDECGAKWRSLLLVCIKSRYKHRRPVWVHCVMETPGV